MIKRLSVIVTLAVLSVLALALPINPTADTATLTVQCANGRWATSKCPAGQEFTPPGIIFSENFDGQPDWVSGQVASGNVISANYAEYVYDGVLGTVPDNWLGARMQGAWGPSTGSPSNHETLEILSANADKAYGGTGKSLVSWRESINATSTDWRSDGVLFYHIPEGRTAIYASFYVKYDPNWDLSGVAYPRKIFRILSWNKAGNISQFFPGGNSGPIFFWDHLYNAYGLRNFIALRYGPWGQNYYPTSAPQGWPRSTNQGDASMNFTTNLKGQGPGGTDVQLPDLVNGGYMNLDSLNNVAHEQVYGPRGTAWTKMGFFVQMNSAPGVADGVFKQWINDKMVINNTTMPWVGTTTEPIGNIKWNVVAIGGNSDFKPQPDVNKYEEWLSIDNLIIADSIPEGIER